MDEYAKGVFECLSWFESLMKQLDSRQDRWDELHKEIVNTVYDIRRGVGVDFRHRLRARL